MPSYSGASGKRYTLGQQLGEGGEGIVYALLGDNSHVAKIYKPERYALVTQDSMERKLKAMIAMNIPTTVEGKLRLAWPQDILYENGSLVGFTMPCVTTKYKIFDVYRTGKGSMREREYTNYTWKYSVQFAYNMAWVVNYLHKYNIVVGDLNQNNIAVDAKIGDIILIDCDSFDIRDPKTGEHFPCVVGLEEMLAPELQQVGNLRNGTFTKESDNFSLAIHIFRLLMNNEDPFGGKITTNASQSNIPANRAIINGECAYVRDVPGKVLLPRMPRLNILPQPIQNLFQRTFNYTATTALSKRKNRTTAAEWVNALWVLGAPEPNPNLKKCSRNSKHVYPAHNTSCPWCAIEKAVPQPRPVPPRPISQPKPVLQKPVQLTPGFTRTSSTQTRTTRTAYRPVRRSPYLFYIVLILFGAASGFVFGDLVGRMVQKAFEIGIPSSVVTAILTIIGVISGSLLAHHFEDKYTHANNGLWWLLLGILALLLPLAVAAALGVVAVVAAAIISIILSVLAFIFAIFCICSICNGS